ncbi:hypothetical protein LIER_16789 [Lithospermum erythrorhizon]|uniref:RNase H type-1 domain-containing protein n=1 Tax=Lithospermum erythrorhizon TaxID=34254 RepID=A0AAV3QB96_LITER
MYFDDMLPYSFMLSQRCSNNVAEYQALILRIEVATELNIPQLDVYGDSQLIIHQLMGEYEVKKPELIPYHGYASRLLQYIDKVSVKHVPRKMNKQADALVGLASSIAYPGKEMSIPVCERWVTPPIFEPQEYETEDEEEVMVTTTVEGTPDH